MSLWGCWAQVPVGRGAGGRDRPLSLLVLLVTRGPVLILSPSMGQTLACVCVAGKRRPRVDLPLSSCICFSVGVSLGLYVPLCGSLFLF